MREEAKSGISVFADFINDSIRNSVIIPADLTIRLLRKSMEDAQKQRKRIIIVDGFPRSLDQALAFEEEVSVSIFVICDIADCSRYMEPATLLYYDVQNEQCVSD